MYRKDEIIEIIRNGENSFVEFKLEDAHNLCGGSQGLSHIRLSNIYKTQPLEDFVEV
ncbi:MAG: hypothetical protein NUV45_14040 [Tepidanaerobacteraceae bacterium]|jgi:hypothetical protein|nr:hypothetical protein [Tepidanaerobacteraceae bacterium]